MSSRSPRSFTAFANANQQNALSNKLDAVFAMIDAGELAEARDKPPMPMLGHVTSSYMSPNVGHSIAMALLRDGRNRMGDQVSLKLMDGRTVTATVTDPVFYDKEGAKARG